MFDDYDDLGFGDIDAEGFVLVEDDSNDDVENNVTEPHNNSTNLDIDDDFGDLSEEMVFVSDEPIDPITAEIEVKEEEIEEVEIKFSVNDLTESEYQTYKGIKAYEKEIEGLTSIEKAEYARKVNVPNYLFYTRSNDYLHYKPYDLDVNAFKKKIKANRDKNYKVRETIAAPFPADTEYQTWSEKYEHLFKRINRQKINITCQIGGIHNHAPKRIYCHWDIRTLELPEYYPALSKFDSCVFERYFKDDGYPLKFKLMDGVFEAKYLNCKRILQIPVYGHMLQADFMAFWKPKSAMFKYFERIISGRDKNNNIDGKKRLVGESDKPELLRPRILVVNESTGDEYALELVFYDTQSLHGIGKSLGKLAEVTGTDIADDKNTYTRENKGDMLGVYLGNPEKLRDSKKTIDELSDKDLSNHEKQVLSEATKNVQVYKGLKDKTNLDNWRKYAVDADLKVYDILINNAKCFYELYQDEEIKADKYFKLPRLTIGRSVSDVISARIITKFEKEIYEDINNLIAQLTYKFFPQNVSPYSTKKQLVKYLKKMFKPNGDYSEVLFENICKNLSVRYSQESDLDLVTVVINAEEQLDKSIQQWIINTFCGGSSAMNLAGLSDTRRINSKILGGRAFRNLPMLTHVMGIICDPDYDGAYSSFMRALELPLCANPFRIQYDLKRKAKTLTLKQTREYYKKELVPGLYQFWADYTEDNHNLINPAPKLLINQQDLIPSYHPHSSISNTSVGAEWLEKTDKAYVYSNQITNGLFTHWQLQILDTVFSKSLKQEIEQCKVKAGIIYRKSDQVHSIRELLDGYLNYEGEDTYKTRKQKEIITIDRFRGWYGFNLGDLIVTPVRKMRARYKKKTPKNEFYKLIGNTVYGVLCSKYFPISNVVTANNITSGVRSAMWCMEKGLNLCGSITDGGLGDLSRVAYRRGKNKLTDKNTIQIHRVPTNKQNDLGVKFAPIGGYKNIEWKENSSDTLIFTNKDDSQFELWQCTDDKNPRFKELTKKIDQLTYEHLAEQFPKLDIFHLPFSDDNGNPRTGIMRVELKGIAREAVLHGATNYMIKGGFHANYDKSKIAEYGERGRVFTAMRSYRKGFESMPQTFMESLGNDPDSVSRSEIFDQSIILKVGLYQERYRSYFENSDYQVGDTVFMDRLIREFPLSAFTFKSQEQRESWEREYISLRGKKGQSIESLFTDENGNVNYQKMIEGFDMWVDAGYESLADVYGDNMTTERKAKLEQSHPEFENLQQRKQNKKDRRKTNN